MSIKSFVLQQHRYLERILEIMVFKGSVSNNQKYCPTCWKDKEKELRKDINKKYYDKIKTVQKIAIIPYFTMFLR